MRRSAPNQPGLLPAQVTGLLAFGVSLALAVGPAGCVESTVDADGQLGRRIRLVSGDASPLPRLAMRNESCPGTEGPCAAYCDGSVADCLANQPDACVPVLVDSGSPLTILPRESGGYAVGERCFEVRSGEGLADPVEFDQVGVRSVARFRFLDAPVASVPAAGTDQWSWAAGDDAATVQTAAVLGGSTLRDFAVAFRNQEVNEGDVRTWISFYREFPGDEQALADQGRAHISLQYPGRLQGAQVGDYCEIGGVGCGLEGLRLDPDSRDLIYRATQMVVDACVAPPPCGLFYEVGTDASAEPVCERRPGGDYPASDCGAANSETLGGRAASLIVATGVPDMVLFSDSAARLFGAVDSLPTCDALGDLPEAVRACRDGTAGALSVPGWPAMTELQVLRVRSLALVPGNGNPSGTTPCTRAQERLEGLLDQCQLFAENRRPLQPNDVGFRSDYGLFVTGETRWVADQAAPDTAVWLRALLVDPAAPYAQGVRRDAGSESIEIDGIVGTAMLQRTEAVLDYTEDEVKPGVRMTCLEPGSSTCLSAPGCYGEGESGTTSCCYGLPQQLIVEVALEGQEKDTPRVEDVCCKALSPERLAAVQAAGVCDGVDAL